MKKEDQCKGCLGIDAGEYHQEAYRCQLEAGHPPPCYVRTNEATIGSIGLDESEPAIAEIKFWPAAAPAAPAARCQTCGGICISVPPAAAAPAAPKCGICGTACHHNVPVSSSHHACVHAR